MTSSGFGTLLDVLAHRANDTPDRTAFTFEGSPHTYRQLWQRANRFATHIRRVGLERGEPVMLILPNSAEFFDAFYGVQCAGGTAVPLFPGSGPERIASIARRCGARIVAAPSAAPPDLNTDSGLRVITPAQSAEEEPGGAYPDVAGDDVAFIQYTSGTTGEPKGVPLTHRGLLTNVRQMIEGMQITPDEVFVSWLPVYHDMGLILKTMVPFYLAAELHLLPTSLAAADRWLRTIERHRATFTAAPDFAYRVCLRTVRDPAGYDLSSLRVALNAAEPVRAKTLHDFEAAFRLHHVMVAGYGLAEATVGVSMWPPGTENRVDGRGFVSVGPPFPGIDVQIISEEGDALPAGHTGEIVIDSPANASGYYQDAEAKAQLFWQGRYIRSGDLGYLDGNGNLTIVGRRKNVIKHAGRTIAPREVEEVVDARPEVRYAAAVGIDTGGVEGEQVSVFAEVRKGHTMTFDDLHALAVEMVAAVHNELGFRPGRVYLLKPRAIPLTHNGKVQNEALKRRYLDGTLRRDGLILYPDY